METRHSAYSLAYKTDAIFGGHFGGKNPRLIAEEIRYISQAGSTETDIQSVLTHVSVSEDIN